MMKFWLYLFGFCSVFTGAQAAQQKTVVAVYASWKHTPEALAQLPWQRFSHLAVASVYPLPDGRLHTAAVEPMLTQLVQRAHQHGKKVLLSVGGAGEGSKGFLQLTKHPEVQAAFVENIYQYARRYQLDGIDIDWEYWTYQNEQQRGGQDPQESARLTALLQALRARFGTELLLTADIVAGDWLGAQYSKEIGQHVDFVNLMAFDFTGAWSGSLVGHHADYATFVKAIKHTLAKGFQPHQLLVGLPAYGIEFINGTTKQIRHVPYQQIVGLPGVNTAVLQSGRLEHLYFETRYLFAKKARYLAKQKLAGFFVFDVLSDHPAAEHSLLEAARRYVEPLSPEVNGWQMAEQP